MSKTKFKKLEAQSKELEAKLEAARAERKKTNQEGLLINRSDNAIYVAKANFDEYWDVFKTTAQSSQATQLFSFGTEDDALWAGRKIADAIGGTFHGKKDPRKIETRHTTM